MRQADALSERGSGRGIASRDRVLSLLALLALWWLAARLAANPALMPPPDRVAAYAWREIVDGDMPMAFAATLWRVCAAFLAAMLGGSLLGYLMGRSRRWNAWLDPWVVIALNLPVLVVIVLAYVWIGLNETAAIVAVVLAKAPSVVVTLREGARALDPGFTDVATAFRLPLGRRLRSVVLPQMLPYLTAAGRSGLSITWKIVLVVELLGRPDGVGYELNMFFQNFNVTGILAYGLAFAGLMLAAEALLLQPMERRATRWRAYA